MNYMDEYELVAEDAAGFPGSSPRSFIGGIDQFLASSPPAEEAEFDDDVIEIDDFGDFDTDSDLFVSDGPYPAEEAEHENFDILVSDVEDDHDLVLDSGDDAIPTHYDTWDEQSGDENTPPRSSSTPLSRSQSIELDLSDGEQGDEGDDPLSDAASIENLETRYQHFQSQLNHLHASRERIADAVRELSARNVETRRRYEEELRSGLSRRDPIRTDRLAAMPGSSRENQRHHPYNRMPPPPAREGSGLGDMASGQQRRADRGTTQRATSNIHNLLDELVQVEVGAPQSRRRRTQTPGNPAQMAEPSARTVAVIDLTEEPDSPDGPLAGTARNRVHHPPPQPLPLTLPSATHRNPRRQMSLNHRTPSLTRSDGSLLGNRAEIPTNVIDLTMDDDSPPAQTTRQPRPVPPRQTANPQPGDRVIDLDAERHIGLMHFFQRAATGAQAISGMDILNRLGGLGGGMFRRHAEDGQTWALPPTPGFLPDPLAGNLPNFNYRANGYNGGGSVKPAYQAPEKAREGYSRATGEDQIFVCPGCEDELVYDPDEGTRTLGTPAAKKVKTKKDREEHHFWALKECGHVSCLFSFFWSFSAWY